MTKRDRTGESDGATPPVAIVKLVDVSADAMRLGFRCRIAVFPTLAKRAAHTRVLFALRDILIASTADPACVRMFGIAFGLAPAAQQPDMPVLHVPSKIEPLPSADAPVAFRVADLTVLAMLRGSMLVVALGDELADVALASLETPSGIGVLDASIEPQPLAVGDQVRVTAGVFADFVGVVVEPPPDASGSRVMLAVNGHPLSIAFERAQLDRIPPTLYVHYQHQRYAIKTRRFLIGRAAAADLYVQNGFVSREHAMVMEQRGGRYITDLGSANGLHYKDLPIDSKRIEEGDEFRMGGELFRFTYRAED